MLFLTRRPAWSVRLSRLHIRKSGTTDTNKVRLTLGSQTRRSCPRDEMKLGGLNGRQKDYKEEPVVRSARYQ